MKLETLVYIVMRVIPIYKTKFESVYA